MKLFQKSALAVAIAAVPFLSVNAMEALDDAALSEMTGQAGVTIETTVDGAQGITIGSILYTDTTEGGSNEIGGGSVAIRGNGSDPAIRLQGQVWSLDPAGDGSLPAGWVNGNSTTKQTIDVDGFGNLITATEAVDGYRTITNADATTDNVTAQKISVGQVLLQSTAQAGSANGAQLVSNLEMTIESGDSSAHILNLSDGGTAAVSAYQAAYNTDNTDPQNPEFINGSITKGLGVAAVAGQGTVGDTGYVPPVAGSGALGSGANMAIVTKGKSRIANLNVDALDGAIAVRGLSYGGGTNGDELMDSTQVIWAKGGAAYSAATQADVDAGKATTADVADGVSLNRGGGVYIQGSDSTGTLTIGALHIGGTIAANNTVTGGNIGRIQISNINRAGSVTRIYGH